MPNLKIEGKLTKVEKKQTRKKDSDEEIGTLVIGNSNGYRVTIVGPEDIVVGLRPEEQVVISLTSEQATLDGGL